MTRKPAPADVTLSRFLSLVLRHSPQTIGLTLDEEGYLSVHALLTAAEAHGRPFTRAQLEEVVRTSDKQRFALSSDGTRIRASQGHSVAVALGYQPAKPPAILYHGTVERFLASIRKDGLVKGGRQHVHLSADLETARKVGARRGRPIVLCVRAGEMFAAGSMFFRSPNCVWLTDFVPAQYIAPID